MDFKKHVLVDRISLSYYPPMNWQEVWGILRWVLAAVIAGFIGQFGKSLALFLMQRRRSKKAPKADPVPTNPASETAPSDVDAEQTYLKGQAKIEKKQAKAEVKRLKKS